MAVELITQAEYARRRGCSAVAVLKAIRAGRISLIDGKIDPAVADVQWQRNTRVRAGSKAAGTNDANLGAPAKPAAGDGDGGYWTIRTRREKAEANLAELKLAEQQGQLVRADDVRSALAKRAAAFREGLMQIPSRLAAQLAAESGEAQAKVHGLIEAEIRAALAQLTEAVE